MELYNKKDYSRAMPLFEMLIPIYKGNEKGEEVLYYYAYCNYNVGDYIMAGYYFRKFASTYPVSKHTEECFYMSAYCYYLDSPKFSLDQENTRQAINEFEYFISRYPNSDRVTLCNKSVDELRAKLAKKSYISAKLYYDLGRYKSADVAIRASLKEYPDSPFREDMMYLLVKTNYQYATNSIFSKKLERMEMVIREYKQISKSFPTSKYLKELGKLSENAEKALAASKANKS